MSEPVVRYLSHPQVVVEENVAPANWELSELGQRRARQFADKGLLGGTNLIVTSAERKAKQTGELIAERLHLATEVWPATGEVDRSTTGFLTDREFSDVMNRFFAEPETRVLGWESASNAQRRIAREIGAICDHGATGDILVVGHGTVGALLLCDLAKVAINRCSKQSRDGGNCFAFTRSGNALLHSWMPLESLPAS